MDLDKCAEARTILFRELRKDPQDVWVLTQISSAYYEERKYGRALEYSRRALRSNPQEPLALWHHAGPLLMLDLPQEAMHVCRRILKMGARKIGLVETTEGIWWAEALLNDCRYAIALCYRDLGNTGMEKRYLRLCLRNRRPGLRSVFSRREIAGRLRELEGRS